MAVIRIVCVVSYSRAKYCYWGRKREKRDESEKEYLQTIAKISLRGRTVKFVRSVSRHSRDRIGHQMGKETHRAKEEKERTIWMVKYTRWDLPERRRLAYTRGYLFLFLSLFCRGKFNQSSTMCALEFVGLRYIRIHLLRVHIAHKYTYTYVCIQRECVFLNVLFIHRPMSFFLSVHPVASGITCSLPTSCPNETSVFSIVHLISDTAGSRETSPLSSLSHFLALYPLVRRYVRESFSRVGTWIIRTRVLKILSCVVRKSISIL